MPNIWYWERFHLCRLYTVVPPKKETPISTHKYKDPYNSCYPKQYLLFGETTKNKQRLKRGLGVFRV